MVMFWSKSNGEPKASVLACDCDEVFRPIAFRNGSNEPATVSVAEAYTTACVFT